MKAKEIGAFEAKTHLSELLEQVRKRAVFFITKRGHPIAELRPVTLPDRRPRFGCDKGRVIIAANFDAPILAEDFPVVTNDPAFRAYGVKVVW